MKKVADWTAEEVLGFQNRKWAPHLTVDQIRGILAHWEVKHPELLKDTHPFKKGEAINTVGVAVEAWGFDYDGMFIVNARISSCGRFHAAPSEYGLTNEQATLLAVLNDGRDLMAYWEI